MTQYKIKNKIHLSPIKRVVENIFSYLSPHGSFEVSGELGGTIENSQLQPLLSSWTHP